MIELIAFIVVVLIAFMLIKWLNREPTIEEARSKGIEKVKSHLKNPVLLEDYAQSTDLSKADVESLVGQGKLPACSWHQYTYVENDTDIKSC